MKDRCQCLLQAGVLWVHVVIVCWWKRLIMHCVHCQLTFFFVGTQQNEQSILKIHTKTEWFLAAIWRMSWMKASSVDTGRVFLPHQVTSMTTSMHTNAKQDFAILPTRFIPHLSFPLEGPKLGSLARVPGEKNRRGLALTTSRWNTDLKCLAVLNACSNHYSGLDFSGISWRPTRPNVTTAPSHSSTLTSWEGCIHGKTPVPFAF